MAKGCCSNLSKFILTTVNVILFLSGLALLCFGIAILVERDKFLDTLSDVGIDLHTIFLVTGEDAGSIVKSSGIALVIIGAVIGSIGMYGCYGACCENRCMLGTYAGALILVIIVELAIIILVQGFEPSIHTPVEEGLTKTLRTLQSDFEFQDDKVSIPSDSVGGGWARLQFTMECCGVYNYTDYITIAENWTATYDVAYLTDLKTYVAASCCLLNGKARIPHEFEEFQNLGGCVQDPTQELVHDQGCNDAISDFIKTFSDVVSWVLGAVALVELFLVIFAIYLCKAGGKSQRAV